VNREPGALLRRGAPAWELWLLRALYPDAGAGDLERLRTRRRELIAHEVHAIDRLRAGDRSSLRPGHRALARNPGLGAGGLLLTMHLGPYQFLPEPFLAVGIAPAILLDERAEGRLRPQAEAMLSHLGLRTRPEWVVATRPGAVVRLVRAVRAGRPLLAFLDGNAGRGGFAETRRRGTGYSLPGREIRVRTGLARLVCRLECPVHPLVVRWSGAGEVDWTIAPTVRFARGTDPAVVTRRLCDWGFGEVLATPEQWSYWEMIKESAACFARGTARTGAASGPPDGLRRDYARAFAICLERSPASVRVVPVREAEIWAESVLVDLETERFYAADGLREADLALIREEQPTLAELRARHGTDWVRRHVLRICLLGLARLGGLESAAGAAPGADPAPPAGAAPAANPAHPEDRDRA
jgi:hypothetical protein